MVLMALMLTVGMKCGKFFITGCIFVSQICMSYCDTVTDALAVKAARHIGRDANEYIQSI